ncbi:hypothetical protein ACJX0J_019251, partial [Zea mays]
ENYVVFILIWLHIVHGVFDLDVIPFYICHGEIYSCDLFVLCILLLGKSIDRLMEFYTRKIRWYIYIYIYIYTQLVITKISSLDIIKIKVFVAFDFFNCDRFIEDTYYIREMY